MNSNAVRDLMTSATARNGTVSRHAQTASRAVGFRGSQCVVLPSRLHTTPGRQTGQELAPGGWVEWLVLEGEPLQIRVYSGVRVQVLFC